MFSAAIFGSIPSLLGSSLINPNATANTHQAYQQQYLYQKGLNQLANSQNQYQGLLGTDPATNEYYQNYDAIHSQFNLLISRLNYYHHYNAILKGSDFDHNKALKSQLEQMIWLVQRDYSLDVSKLTLEEKFEFDLTFNSGEGTE
jgi:hypothetical protein